MACQEAHVLVSHCFQQPFKDFVLSLEHAGLGEIGYWHLSCHRCHGFLRSACLATSPEERHVAILVAMERCDQLLVAAWRHQRLASSTQVWDASWPQRLWCLYELLAAEDLQKDLVVTSLEGLLGPKLADTSRSVARILCASNPRQADGPLELQKLLGESGMQVRSPKRL